MDTRRAIIHLLDGTSLTSERPRQVPDDLLKFRNQVENAMKSPQLCLEVDGNLRISKTNSVKFFESDPAPEELPPGIVRNARKVVSAEAARGVISLKNSRIEPLNHERSAEHRLGSSGKDSKRAETVLGAPVHGEGGRA